MLKKLIPLGGRAKSLLFTNQSTRQTVAKNTIWLTVSQFGGRLIRAVIVIYAARILGAAEWGVFSYAVGLAAILTIFTDLGIGAILTREASRIGEGERKSRLIGTAFFIKLALLAAGIIIIIAGAPYLTSISEVRHLLPWVALILAFDTLREFGFSLIRALEKMEWEAGLFLFTNAMIVIAGIVALKISGTVAAFTIAYAIGTGAGMVATFYFLRTRLSKIFSHFDAKLVRPIITSAWPFAVSAVLGGLMINTDILIIGFFGTAEAVGFYSAAQRPILLAYLLPAIFAASTFPAFSRFANGEPKKMRALFERTVGVAFLIGFPLVLGGIILAPDLINLVFGEAYRAAIAPFQVLLLTLLVNFPSVILTNALFAHNRQKNLLLFAAIGGLGNVLFDILLIPQFGILGAAWATLFAQILGNLYLWRAMQNIERLPLPGLTKIAPASLLMMMAVSFLSFAGFPLAFTIILAAVLYWGILKFLDEPLLRELTFTLKPRA